MLHAPSASFKLRSWLPRVATVVCSSVTCWRSARQIRGQRGFPQGIHAGPLSLSAAARPIAVPGDGFDQDGDLHDWSSWYFAWSGFILAFGAMKTEGWNSTLAWLARTWEMVGNGEMVGKW